MSLKAALIAVSVVATLAGSWGFFFLTSAPIVVDPPVRVTVKPGSTARDVIAELADKGVVRSERVMTFLARMSGVDREIRFGDHDFAGSLTPEHVLEELMRDPKPVVRITIPEGLTLYEVGELLESQEIVEANAYRKAACAPELLTALSIPTGSNCAEGYLFPDTYNLAPEMDAPAVVQLQVQRFQRVVTAIVSALEKQGVERPANRLSLHETVVLASIVEKETRVEKDARSFRPCSTTASRAA